MNKMIEHIVQYYQSERNTALIATVIGAIFFISAFALPKYLGNDKLIKGLSYAFWGASLFFLTAGVSVVVHNNRKIEEAKFLSQTNLELQQSEFKRMELVVQKGYRSALILFSTLVVSGLVFVLFSPNDLWKGIGLGLLIIGTVGHGTEAFSMQKNKAYQQRINSIKF